MFWKRWPTVTTVLQGIRYRYLIKGAKWKSLYSCTTDSEWTEQSRVEWCAIFWVQGPNHEQITFVGHAITNTYIASCFLYRVLHNNTYIFYTSFVNDNTLSTTMPVLGRQNLSEINPIQLELILQHLKLIVLNKILLRETYSFIKYLHLAATLLSGF